MLCLAIRYDFNECCVFVGLSIGVGIGGGNANAAGLSVCNEGLSAGCRDADVVALT
jgi:hypothetical protein